MKAVIRVLLLAAAVCFYFADRGKINFLKIFDLGFSGAFLWIIWVMLATEMLLRIFPNKFISMGARKHFAGSYKAAAYSEKTAAYTSVKAAALHKGAFLSALFWFSVSAVILIALFFSGILTPEAVTVLVLIYAVADLFFIAVFCPFRVLFMRNQCCVVCRIYNWDYFMMCAPMILFPGFYSISLVLLSVAVLLRWEISLQKNPHFFMRETNERLRCEQCTERPRPMHCLRKNQR